MIEATNFIEEAINEELAEGKIETVHTRFPPEPNGYLHIGHCKAIAINFGTARKYGGVCNLRMDDTNPTKEDTEYVDAIREDIRWLGFDWGDRFFYGSDYFEKDYEFAVELIRKGLAYVCELTPDQFREYRGDLTHPAVSPYRDRPVEENLDLFARMRAGEFPEGKYTLRAKIDLASGNFWMRDPVIYRIKHVEHHRQGNRWCIYPTYDFAHPIQDALEGVNISLCSLEFEIHRPLYDWVIEHVSVPARPRQIEFARLNLTYTVMSKRYLRALVEEGRVDGWDDPRMPTLCGMRRRGYPPEAILDFCQRIGVAKSDSLVDISLLEHCVREQLNRTALRRVAVLHPIRVVVENFPEGETAWFELPNHPQNESAGKRRVAFTRELYIDAEDFSLDPPSKFFRLKPGGEVRLMGAYLVKYVGCKKDDEGNVTEITVHADLETGCGMPADGRKVKGTIHWLSASESVETDVYLFDHLYTLENTGDLPEGMTLNDCLNPQSQTVLKGCRVERALAEADPGEQYQFVRTGYFTKDSKRDAFLQIVELKDKKPF